MLTRPARGTKKTPLRSGFSAPAGGVKCKNMNKHEAIKWIGGKCGSGWLPLVERIYNEIPTGTVVSSVYQKWGSLMFDATPWNDTVETVHDDIEAISLKTCEICGTEGKETEIAGWRHTRCEKHVD